ncbi:MAG TPA: MBL fold metallo-hydrolase [Burkholderiales bacterium]|nr:MBL fold metallo-hydrolase [Burkholderiales bacterium]
MRPRHEPRTRSSARLENWNLQFLGATGTVTGSKYLVTAGYDKVLVDCGLFQGFKQLRLRNWAPLPLKPAALRAVVLSHAHIDHSGYLPLLVKNGFAGKVRCSEATYELCRILLPDAGRLQEEEADYANRRGFSKHRPAQPLYTEEDAKRSLEHFAPVGFEKEIELGRVRLRLAPAGHILGASIVCLADGARTLVFSGDLGRPNDPIMVAPSAIRDADYLVLESTYGNRLHDPEDPRTKLGRAINKTVSRGGVVVIPSFAVGRAQSLLYHIHQLKAEGVLPADLPVYLNSPMAADATEIYNRHRAEHRLTPEQCRAMCAAATIVNTPEESRQLNEKKGPMVIIAASGMATGGRVVHHLKAFAPDARNTILFSGFQAGGTRGDTILSGAEAVKIHGQYVPIRAEVAVINNLSAHADSAEILDWLRSFGRPPRETFITHGEPVAADALRRRIEEQLRWRVRVPDYLDKAVLQ